VNEYFRTLLTGEPLEWQLTNAQRMALGLAPVEEDWQFTEVPCGLLADCETYVYLDGPRVMRVISHGENYYEECCVEAVLTEDGRIAPAKPEGKSAKLTAANLHKRRHMGVSLTFDCGWDVSFIRVKDHDHRRMLREEQLAGRMTTREFAAWLDKEEIGHGDAADMQDGTES